MKPIQWTVGPFAENTLLLIRERQALLIDPGFSNRGEFDEYKQCLRNEAAELLGVVLTHAHVDHVLGLHRVLIEHEVPVYLCDRDRYLWENVSPQAGMFGFDMKPFAFSPEPLLEGQWDVGPFSFDVRFTPGHSPDHMVLYSEPDGLLIGGDTLFQGSIGRTDLYKGSYELLETSIREKLYTLPDEVEVYPGHGPTTTIGVEKRSNPFVKMED